MKDINKTYKYRVQIFNNSSWGGWITVCETDSPSIVEQTKAHYKAKGYETTSYSLT